jgi:hypothetical protein
LQAIEGLKVNFSEEDLDLAFLKRLKKTKTQQSLAIIIARKNS